MNKGTLDQMQSSFIDTNPGEWPVYEQPITEAQVWHLRFLTATTGEPIDENLTKAEAAKKINELQAKIRRGKDNH